MEEKIIDKKTLAFYSEKIRNYADEFDEVFLEKENVINEKFVEYANRLRGLSDMMQNDLL